MTLELEVRNPVQRIAFSEQLAKLRFKERSLSVAGLSTMRSLVKTELPAQPGNLFMPAAYFNSRFPFFANLTSTRALKIILHCSTFKGGRSDVLPHDFVGAHGFLLCS